MDETNQARQRIMSEWQAEIYNNIEERGYRMRGTLTAKAFFAKQILKTYEELGELVRLVFRDDSALARDAILLGEWAKGLFDMLAPDDLQRLVRWDHDQMGQVHEEMADVAIPLACMAEVTDEMAGGTFNLFHAALRKSQADIERGVRGGTDE